MDFENLHGRKKKGAIGEELACAVLTDAGYSIVRRNFRCRYGEVDIIAKKDGRLCFVEVKTRSGDMYGSGREAVDTRKRRHIRLCAEHYLEYTREMYESIEFQVMEISVAHIKGLAF